MKITPDRMVIIRTFFSIILILIIFDNSHWSVGVLALCMFFYTELNYILIQKMLGKIK